MLEGLVVVAIPQAAYDTIIETLEVDAESSNFDRELRQQIQAALAEVCEITPELTQLLEHVAGWFGTGGTVGGLRTALTLMEQRLVVAATPSAVADEGEEEDGEDEEE